jgi:hypothetical protein
LPLLLSSFTPKIPPEKGEGIYKLNNSRNRLVWARLTGIAYQRPRSSKSPAIAGLSV